MLAMKTCLVVAAACAALVVNAAAAQAQSDRRFGLVIGFPTVGVEWQAAGRIALRVDGTYRRSSVESEAIPVPSLPSLPNVIRIPTFEIRSSTTNTGVDLGLSVLFDVHRSDELRLYVVPHAGVRISRTEVVTTISGLSVGELPALTVPANRESTSSAPSGGVALGASHHVSPRLRIFGEAGVTYTRGNLDGLAFNDITQSSFGVGGTVGVVVLF
jgi:hypothetical protein